VPVSPGVDSGPVNVVCPAAGVIATAFPRPQRPPELAVVSRRLDRGRLCAAEHTKALGWAPHLALAAEVAADGLVRLRPDHSAEMGSGRRFGQVHVDAGCRIAVPAGLRAQLGVDADGIVLAVFEHGDDGEGVVEIIAPILAVRALRHLANQTTDTDAADGDVAVAASA
jgi:bifunctional DNA-binding transcriptional regulator/antitoxin component of YhaV-PrlF toxin-antitoxin module